jgi:acyl carrier protein
LRSAEILTKVVGALSEVLGVDEDQIKPESRLVGDLEASSLDVVDLLFQLKRMFGVELTLAEVRKALLRQSVQRQAGAAKEPGEGDWDDALFDNVTVQDVVGWVDARVQS